MKIPLMDRPARTIRLSTVFELSLYVLIALSSVMLALAEGFEQAPPPQSFTIPLIVLAYFLVNRSESWALPWWAANGLGLVSVVVSFWNVSGHLTFSGGFLPKLPSERLLDLILAGAHLLVFLTWVVLFLRKTNQQYWWLWALCVLQVAVGAILTNESYYGALLVCYLFFAVWTLSVFSLLQGQQQFDRAQQTAHSTQPADDPGGKSLAPAEAPERASPTAHPLLSAWREPSQAVGSVQRDPAESWINPRFVGGVFGTASLAFVLAFLFFLLVPRHPAIWSRGRVQSEEQSEGGLSSTVGFSRQIQLGDLGQILSSTKKVMEVRLTDPQTGAPLSVSQYARDLGYDEPLFRGMVTTTYDSGTWQTWHSDDPRNGGEMSLPQPSQVRGPLVKQEIRLELVDRELLFAMHPVVGGEFPESGNSVLMEPLTAILKRSLENSSSGAVTYLLLSPRRIDQPRALPAVRYLARHFELGGGPYQTLPRHLETLTRLAREKSGYLETPRPSPEEMARRLERFLKESGEFSYTLNANVADRGIDPIEDFLLHRKKGHCEYFASALTLMLRVVGIPSRLVSGFKGGNVNQFSGLYEVEERHAHAWVEAYFSKGHWVTLDPTPAARDESVESLGAEAGRWTDFRRLMRDFWSRFVVELNESQQRRLLKPFQALFADAKAWLQNGRSHLRGFVEGLKQQLRSPKRWISWQGGLVTFVLLSLGSGVFWIVRRLWKFWRKLRLQYFDSQRLGRTVEFYERFRQLCAQRGITRNASQTPREFAAEVRRRLSHLLPAADLDQFPLTLVESFYDVRYGAQTLNAATLGELDQQLKRFESALAES